MRDERDRSEAQAHGDDEAPSFANEIALLFFEGAQLARIGHGVTDILEGLQHFLGMGDRRIIFDQRLLVGEADGDLVDAGKPTQRFFDRSGAERAVEAPNAGADLLAAGTVRWLLAP